MKKVVLATTNKGKLKEFTDMLAPLGYELIPSNQLATDLPNVIEDGNSFEENAIIKAKAYYERFGLPTMADDSGLAIDVLGGRPGIYSARYAGMEQDDKANLVKVLEEMKGIPTEQRTARFCCAIAYVNGEQIVTAWGEREGVITTAPRGEGGFGYDPIFFLPEMGRTMAELSLEEKNKLSHRYLALKQLVRILKEQG